MGDVRIGGVGMARFAKRLDTSLKQLAREAVTAVLDDAGLAANDIDYAVVGNAGAGVLQGQSSIVGQVVLRDCGIGEIPIVNVENACAGGSTAFHLAWQAVALGEAEIALALGVEKMTTEDQAAMMRAFLGGMDVERAEEILAAASAVPPVDGDGQSSHEGRPHTAFMDLYASVVRQHMREYGMTKEQMALVAAKNRRFGALNPYAQKQNPVTPEEVLQSPLVTEPLTIRMCAPLGDGAAAAILVSPEAVSRVATPGPHVAASVLRAGTLPGSDSASAEERAIAAAYERAAIGPEDLDVAEVHDATSPAELIIYEHLGLCEPGDGGRLVEKGDTDLGGSCPVNPSGGLIARGHPIAATGLAQIAELTLQLRGQAGQRQVEGARVALAQNGGGWLGEDAGAQSVHVLVM